MKATTKKIMKALNECDIFDPVLILSNTREKITINTWLLHNDEISDIIELDLNISDIISIKENDHILNIKYK